MRISHTLFFLMLVLLGSPAAAQLLNAGFEEVMPGVDIARWETFDNPSTMLRDSLHFQSGRFSMRIVGGKGMHSFSQTIKFKSEKYQQLWLKAYIRTERLKGNAGLLALVTGPDKKQSYVNASEGEGISVNTEWVAYTIPVIVEPGESSIILGGVIHGQGTAWFDDFEFTAQPGSGSELGTTYVRSGDVQRSRQPRVVQAYVKEYLTIIRKNSLNKESIDMKKLQMVVESLTATAKQPSDCHATFLYALKLLNDRHSHFFTPGAVAEWQGGDEPEEIEYASGKMIDNVGYIKVPAFISGNDGDQVRFADSLQTLLRGMDKQQPLGWIIDLRDNFGGNCWPMLAGLGPLIENEDCAYFSSKGILSKPIRYTNGASRVGDEAEVTVTKPYSMSNRNLKTAVLVAKRTASSGELVAVCFSQRPNTVLMGITTGGLSTNNRMFKMSDGAMLNLTTSVYADRMKKEFPAGIVPDVLVEANEDAIVKALAWLKENPR